MPRAHDYLLEGYTYHLTHRCQNREFHLNFKAERNTYREWLREGARRYEVPVYGYCITKNHVHVVVHAEDPEAVGRMMQLAAGTTAKRYNLRRGHLGSVWEHPYHCTIVQDGQHLLNCLRYVDLNMVRPGVVQHPRDWPWCGYDELTMQRKRYRIIDTERLLQSLGMGGSPAELAALHAAAVDEHIAAGVLDREPEWTEPLALGSEAFMRHVAPQYRQRRHVDASPAADGTWTLRESKSPYTHDSGPKTGL